ncbi:hypothetical protein MKX03_034813, partial [Papaver bracteatum]
MGMPNRSKERRSLIDSEAKVKMDKTKKSKKRRSKPRIESSKHAEKVSDPKVGVADFLNSILITVVDRTSGMNGRSIWF